MLSPWNSSGSMPLQHELLDMLSAEATGPEQDTLSAAFRKPLCNAGAQMLRLVAGEQPSDLLHLVRDHHATAAARTSNRLLWLALQCRWTTDALTIGM
jgi:hypothetical protein